MKIFVWFRDKILKVWNHYNFKILNDEFIRKIKYLEYKINGIY